MDASRRRLAAIDAAWLRMDRPDNPMVITSLLGFEQPLTFAAIEGLVRERLLPIRRFRERVVTSRLGVSSWELDPRFDLADHLDRVALPAPGGDAELAVALAGIAAQPLDPRRPLWRLHVVEGHRGGTALVLRVHHCVGDGVALIAMLLGITDEGRALRPPEVGLVEPPARSLRARVRRAAAKTRELGRLLALPPDPPNPLRGPLGLRKRFALSPPFELARIKQLAGTQGATINDVAVTAIAGALRRELGRHLPARSLRAVLPMYLRGRSRAGELGNHFGLVYLALPLELADPAERLAATHRRMRALKRSPEATVVLELLGALGLAPPLVEELAIALFTAKASVMITNVAGPPAQLHLEGHPVATMAVWAPVSGALAVGISVMSYAGALRLGVVADPGVLPDPARLVDAIGAELDALARITRPAPAGATEVAHDTFR
jgi:diacylglycerol O-acyltransferase